MIPTWACPDGHVNDLAYRVCDLCGAERPRRVPEKNTLPAYREAEGRTLVPGELNAETQADLDALYATWGLGRKFGQRRAAPAAPTPEEQARHARRKVEILNLVGHPALPERSEAR